MANLMRFLGKLSNAIDRFAAWVSILYAFLVTVVVLGSVFLRMAGQAPSWSEEFARWMIIGIAFISSSIALKRGGHIGITAIVKILPESIAKVIIQVSNVLVLIFLGYVFWFGLSAAMKAINHVGDIIPVSMIYIKMHLPIGMLMMIVHVLYYIVAITVTKDAKKFLLSQ